MPSPRASLLLLLAPLGLAFACGGPEEPDGSTAGAAGASSGNAGASSGNAGASSGNAGASTAGTSGAAGTAGATSGSAGAAGAASGSGGAAGGSAGAAGGAGAASGSAGAAGVSGSTSGASGSTSGASGSTSGASGSTSGCGALSCGTGAGSCQACSTAQGGPCHDLPNGCASDPACSANYGTLESCGTGASCGDVLYDQVADSARMVALQQCSTCGACASACGGSSTFLCQQCAPHPSTTNLASLSDAFDVQGAGFPGWTPTTTTGASSIANRYNGAANLQPTTNVPWYGGTQGPFYYKTVTGDFMVTSRVSIGLVNSVKYQMGGLMVQSATDPAEWSLVALGASGPVGNADVVIGSEGKFSHAGTTLYETVPTSITMDLRICVVGCTVQLLRKAPTDSSWTPVDGSQAPGVQSRAARPGLSTANPLRVGMAAWSTVATVDDNYALVTYESVDFAPPDASCN